MAKAELNPMFSSLNGRIGGFVFYSYNGATCVRAYVRPANPKTRAQQKNRALFANAMRAWQGLSAFDKGSFSRRGRRLGMTGHNLFISRYMTSHSGRRPLSGANTMAPHPAQSAISPPFHLKGHSVCAPPAVKSTQKDGWFELIVVCRHACTLQLIQTG